MINQIKFNDGSSIPCAITSDPAILDIFDNVRLQKKIRIIGTVEDAKNKFTGTPYQYEWDSTTLIQKRDENGNLVVDDNFKVQYIESIIIESQDLSEYCVPGDIVDHRDGSVSVYMGKKTELELTQAALEAAMLLIMESA